MLIELPHEQLSATMLDVSVGGAAIWGPRPAPEGPMRIRIELDATAFELEGVAVREFASDGGSVWGVAFRDVDEATRARLRAYVEMHA